MKKYFKIVVILFVIFSLYSQAYAWSGRCVGVTDGDTIKVLHDSKEEKIRLYGIDCPEKGQAFGNKAKWFTSDLVFGKTVEVKSVDIDRYGRTVAWVYVNNTCVNEELLRAGFAWHYKRYSKEQRLAALEEEARTAKRGLWADKNPMPPWEWRKSKSE